MSQEEIETRLTELLEKRPHDIFSLEDFIAEFESDRESVLAALDRMIRRPGSIVRRYGHGQYRSTSAKWIPWGLQDAVGFVRQLGITIPEYNFALGGGTIHKHGLRKDVDIIVFPFNRSPRVWDPMEIARLLTTFGMTRERTHEQLLEWWLKKGETPDPARLVEIWSYHRRRVDVFYMSGHT